MKQQISPVVATIVILAVVGLAALGWVKFAGVQKSNTPPPTMPAQVAKDWAKYTSGKGSGGSIPTGQAGPSTSPPAGGGSVGAPAGVRGGYGLTTAPGWR